MPSLTVMLPQGHLVRILNVANNFVALLHFVYAIIAFPSFICLRQILVLNVFKASRVYMATHVRVKFRLINFWESFFRAIFGHSRSCAVNLYHTKMFFIIFGLVAVTKLWLAFLLTLINISFGRYILFFKIALNEFLTLHSDILLVLIKDKSLHYFYFIS